MKNKWVKWALAIFLLVATLASIIAPIVLSVTGQ